MKSAEGGAVRAQRDAARVEYAHKAILLCVFTVLSALTHYVSIITYYPAAFFFLDMGWFLGLQEQLQQGRLLGRDLYFTYGPLAQIIASFGSLLRSDPSPVVGYATTMFVIELASQLVFASALMILREVRPLALVFVCTAYILLGSRGFPSLRAQMLVFSSVVLAVSLTAPQRVRRFYAVIIGMLWFVGQCLTTDTAIYALATASLFLGMMMMIALRPRWFALNSVALLRPRDYLEMLIIVLFSFMLCNLILEIYFQATQPYYGLFDNIRYNLAIVSGYARTMTVPWSADSLESATLFMLMFFNAVSVFLITRISSSIRFIHSSIVLLIAGVVFFRGAITRSDEGHIFDASDILLFLFLVLVISFSVETSLWRDGSRQVQRRLRLFGLILLVLLASWWRVNTYVFRNLIDIMTGQVSLREKVEQIWSTRADIEALAPSSLREALDDNKQVVNFPYANYIGMALGKPTLAPILQSYAALNEQLQRLYVDRLRAAQSQVEVIYAIEGVSNGAAIDNVQYASRLPVIVEYLIEHFHLKYDRVFSDGLYVLAPREAPIELLRRDVAFELVRSSDVITITADSQMCAFLEMDLMIDYPVISLAGRPRALIATFIDNGKTVLTTRLVAIEEGRPFATLVYLGQPHGFSRVFADEYHQDMVGVFDTVVIGLEPASLFSVSPSRVAVGGLRCVNLPLDSTARERRPYVLTSGETLNLWEQSWLPIGGSGALRRIDNGFFIHSGYSHTIGPYLAPPGMCITATAAFHPEAAGKPEADGAEFVATILPLSGASPMSSTVALAPDESARLSLMLPNSTPFDVRFETLPRGNSAWDWALWMNPRIEPCRY
ncbi:hypothetical protein [Roseiflexus sp.]|uniref:hypothetical protein n=1 Tax=Roseiflexus sp. TaxID=2562120 RepID=UPI00398B07D3